MGAALALLLSACISAGQAGDAKTVAMIPNYKGGGQAQQATQMGFSAPANIVSVTLGETDPTTMFIHLSTPVVPAGPVSFVVTNQGTQTHEFVVLQSKTGAGSFPIVSFEGEANRIDEAANGVVNVGETGDMKPGTSKTLSIDMKPGHYAVVCNLPGHYAMGMHQDLWVTPAGATPVTVELGDSSPTSMFIHLSQPTAPAGLVTFIITNSSTTTDHELVGFLTKTPAGLYPITSFDGEANRVNEDNAGVAVVDTGAALKPGTSQMLTVDMKSGHYAMVCNLAGHYAAGMHQDFWVTPGSQPPVTVTLGETDPTSMFIHMSTPVATQGPVSFLVTNTGTETHEFVVLGTETPAANFPIVSFEGEANRIDEAAKGVVNVGETGDMKPGTSKILTINLKAGHYAVVCNLPGHYGMGMHQDFWVTPPGATPVTVTLGETDPTTMFIHLSQPVVPQGKVSFIVTNTGNQTHEFVALASKTPAADFPIVSFEGEKNRIDEAAKGVVNVGETGDMKPATAQMLTINLAAGHYAVVCNLPGHYAMGMHQDLWVTPDTQPPVAVALGETDPNTMFIHLSQPYATQGPVSFLVTNTGTETHEFVVLASKTSAADFPIVSFEGEANRIDEAAKGVVNVGETGDMDVGATMLLTIDLKAGHYALVCNLPGHYGMGMHQDFWVAPPAAQ